MDGNLTEHDSGQSGLRADQDLIEKRTHLNLKVPPKLKATLERIAKRERRSVSNLSELLLDWALEKLRHAGTTMALLEDGNGNGGNGRER